MRAAIIGSRGLYVDNIEQYLPKGITEVVSGGACGVDACARAFAARNGLRLTEFFPDYKTYGRSAPLKRNLQIIAYVDAIFAFWDGHSHGTQYVIKHCKQMGKPITVYVHHSVSRSDSDFNF